MNDKVTLVSEMRLKELLEKEAENARLQSLLLPAGKQEYLLLEQRDKLRSQLQLAQSDASIKHKYRADCLEAESERLARQYNALCDSRGELMRERDSLRIDNEKLRAEIAQLRNLEEIGRGSTAVADFVTETQKLQSQLADATAALNWIAAVGIDAGPEDGSGHYQDFCIRMGERARETLAKLRGDK